MTCSQMGGMCETAVQGATPEEMIKNGMAHLESAHPEMATSIKSLPKDDPMIVSWSQKFMDSWNATPEMS